MISWLLTFPRDHPMPDWLGLAFLTLGVVGAVFYVIPEIAIGVWRDPLGSASALCKSIFKSLVACFALSFVVYVIMVVTEGHP